LLSEQLLHRFEFAPQLGIADEILAGGFVHQRDGLRLAFGLQDAPLLDAPGFFCAARVLAVGPRYFRRRARGCAAS